MKKLNYGSSFTRMSKAPRRGDGNRILNVVLGNQLYPQWVEGSTADEFLLIESRGMCARYQYHRQKLVLILAGMRRFAEGLRERGFIVHYVELEKTKLSETYFDILSRELARLVPDRIRISEIADRGFGLAFDAWSRKAGVEVEQVPSRLFLTPTELFPEALGTRRPFMKTFYEWQRKRLKVLVDSRGNPVGGKWSFDEENRKKLPRDYRAPKIRRFARNPIVEEVIALVDRVFPENPGRATDFWLPTEAVEASEWLDHFLEERFEEFGPYEDALKSGDDSENDLLNHSALAPLMNVGLLPAETVLERTLAFARKRKIPLASLEGFVRQVIGWREFVKGIDWVYGERQASENFFGHRRRLKSCWYDGTTGLVPVDQAIHKAVRRGYNHHIERLMVLSNVMLLCEVDPRDVHRWFMEMYVDSSEWVMGPNVYGMGQFSDGGIFATKPYICGSNYILKMSDFKRGEWCDTWDALYWNFVERHLEFFRKNPRMGMAGNLVAKMPEEKRAHYRKLAEAFREKVTEPGA